MKSYRLVGMAGLVACAFVTPSFAITLDEIDVWAGTGTNRAGMVIHWSSPEVRNDTSVPSPISDHAMAWGFRWNGSATGEEMFNTILAADPRLFAVASSTAPSGKAILGLGFDLNNNRVWGVRNGTNILASTSFTNGIVAGDSMAPMSSNRWTPLICIGADGTVPVGNCGRSKTAPADSPVRQTAGQMRIGRRTIRRRLNREITR